MIEKIYSGEINRRYKSATFLVRLFIRLRWLYTPYSSISFYLPNEGKILDLGCGHGLLSITLALLSSKRHVIGIDHDNQRILDANAASKDIKNISFMVGTASVLETSSFSGIAMLDFLHYFPFDTQKELLKKAYTTLQPGGVLVFREIDTDAGFVSILNRIYEKIMVTLKFTKAEQLFFRTKNEWVVEAQNAGFQAEYILHHKFPFRDVLFVCRK